MPSQNKKKSKKNKLQNVKIKEEPVDIQSLSYHVDDRVELIKQTFSTLKSKRIKSLAPDFLQGKSIEKLQEFCLNEVLGISKKRLLSIINATKCPSDTESSDSDSDVEKIEEHISLDEISDDSNDEMLSVNKNAKTNTASGNKEMTVLELLELQARARAIRSQLALEPITKIELDSDNEEKSLDELVTNNGEKPEANNTNSKSKISENNKSEKRKKIVEIEKSKTKKDESEIKKEPLKRVKLKRNFRVRQVGDDLSDDDKEKNLKITHNSNEDDKKLSNNHKVIDNDNMNLEKPQSISETGTAECSNLRSNCSSPEVITMFPSPVTLYILSDSEEEHQKKNKTKQENIITFSEDDKLEEAKSADEPEDGEILEDEEIKAVKNEVNAEKFDVDKINETDTEKETANESSSSSSIDLERECFDYELKDTTDNSEDEEEPLKNKESETETEATNKESEAILSINMSNTTDEMEILEEEKIEIVNDHPNDIIDIVDSDLEDEISESDKSKTLDENAPTRSWNTRWLESSKVTKILATSRLGNKVRDNIKKKKSIEEKTKIVAPVEEKSKDSPVKEHNLHEVGSVQHYRELISKNKED